MRIDRLPQEEALTASKTGTWEGEVESIPRYLLESTEITWDEMNVLSGKDTMADMLLVAPRIPSVFLLQPKRTRTMLPSVMIPVDIRCPWDVYPKAGEEASPGITMEAAETYLLTDLLKALSHKRPHAPFVMKHDDDILRLAECMFESVSNAGMQPAFILGTPEVNQLLVQAHRRIGSKYLSLPIEDLKGLRDMNRHVLAVMARDTGFMRHTPVREVVPGQIYVERVAMGLSDIPQVQVATIILME